jgi:hypothetical protein
MTLLSVKANTENAEPKKNICFPTLVHFDAVHSVGAKQQSASIRPAAAV